MYVGDNVVCINSIDGYLTLNRIYTILNVENGYDGSIAFRIKDDNNDKHLYFPNRFVSLREYRKQKLNKILCIK